MLADSKTIIFYIWKIFILTMQVWMIYKELISEDGKWYLVNHSELCTTSVEANRKIEIQSGDIIILGDRRFKFEAE